MRRRRKKTARLASLHVFMRELLLAMVFTTACATLVLHRWEPGQPTKLILGFYTTIILALNALVKLFITTLPKTPKCQSASKSSRRISRSRGPGSLRNGCTRSDFRFGSLSIGRGILQRFFSQRRKIVVLHTKLTKSVHRISRFLEPLRKTLSKLAKYFRSGM